jgi:hypothetical protein
MAPVAAPAEEFVDVKYHRDARDKRKLGLTVKDRDADGPGYSTKSTGP